jgi:long-chain acyl-CoA synthetase
VFILGDKSTTSPKGKALFDSSRNVWNSYRNLSESVRSLSMSLSSGRKRLIFLFCRNDIESVVAYLASVEAGHAVALIDSEIDNEFKVNLINLYKPDVVIGSLLNPELKLNHRGFISLGGDESQNLRILHSNESQDGSLNPELAVLLSTSGTTGSPKLVRLTRINLEENARSIVETLSISSSQRAITSLPIHYSYGLSVLNSHLRCGASIVLTNESVLSREFWKLFNEQECTSFSGVPFSYQIMDRIGFARFELPSLRVMTQAGGKMNEQLTRKYHQLSLNRNFKLMIMYGQTEATARMACLPYNDLPDKVGSAGVAITGGRFAIMLDSDETNEPGRIGEVIYYGPNVMQGYAESRADLAKGDELKGKLMTGDLGYLDQEGRLFLTGRLKRIAKVAGLRVNLDEIQAFFEQQFPCAVIAKDEKLVAFVVEQNLECIREFSKDLARRLRLHHNIFSIKQVDCIPIKSSGKIDYAMLERQAR